MDIQKIYNTFFMKIMLQHGPAGIEDCLWISLHISYSYEL
jgi:hypothetical protein